MSKMIEYEAKHAAIYHCPAANEEEFEEWVRIARAAWQSQLVCEPSEEEE
jgi:hypothetical protein